MAKVRTATPQVVSRGRPDPRVGDYRIEAPRRTTPRCRVGEGSWVEGELLDGAAPSDEARVMSRRDWPARTPLGVTCTSWTARRKRSDRDQHRDWGTCRARKGEMESGSLTRTHGNVARK